MKSYSSNEIIAIMKADGWYEIGCRGDHHYFKHPTKRGKVIVAHPKKDVPIGTAKAIARQAGIKLD